VVPVHRWFESSKRKPRKSRVPRRGRRFSDLQQARLRGQAWKVAEQEEERRTEKGTFHVFRGFRGEGEGGKRSGGQIHHSGGVQDFLGVDATRAEDEEEQSQAQEDDGDECHLGQAQCPPPAPGFRNGRPGKMPAEVPCVCPCERHSNIGCL
jgi:hypothetical protein